MSSGTTDLTGRAAWTKHGAAHRASLTVPVGWIGCDHDGCDAITSAPGDVSAIVDPAAADGWALTDSGDYCPAHADEHGDDGVLTGDDGDDDGERDD